MDTASAATSSMTCRVDPVRPEERNDAPGGDPADVAVLLNDAKAALHSDRDLARACVIQALELLHQAPARACGPSSCHGGLAGWQVRRISAYIDAHLGSCLRVVDLAELVGLSASHFSRAFKQSFGQAPMNYVSLQRVRLAQRLLLTTEESMCQISLACGMCDQAHLTRVFRRIVGDSPLAWRRRHAMAPSAHTATSRHRPR